MHKTCPRNLHMHEHTGLMALPNAGRSRSLSRKPWIFTPRETDRLSSESSEDGYGNFIRLAGDCAGSLVVRVAFAVALEYPFRMSSVFCVSSRGLSVNVRDVACDFIF